MLMVEVPEVVVPLLAELVEVEEVEVPDVVLVPSPNCVAEPHHQYVVGREVAMLLVCSVAGPDQSTPSLP